MRDHVIVDIETAAIEDAAQYVEPVEAPANYKDPAKIAEYVATAQAKAVDRCGLDPDLCRIVALGWMFPGEPSPQVRVCKTVTEEKDTLEYFWRDVQEATLVTFNGLKFDLPVLMRRSLYLGIPYPRLSLDRYRTPHIDLFNQLTYNGTIQGHSLKFYLSRFNIATDDLTSGKDIAALVKAGEWAAVATHCQSDVIGTKDLALRIGAIRLAREVSVA
jgi:predicted PolB exonuclease-like 3'-5' exonuclease